MDNTSNYFILLLNATDKVIERDFACIDILAWANEMSIAKYKDTQMMAIAALLAFGLSDQVARCESGIRNYLRAITGSGSYETDEQWTLVAQRDELRDLKEKIPKLLEAIVKGCGLSDEKYHEVLTEIKREIEPYENVRFEIRNVRRMKRYLDLMIAFIKNLDEAKLSTKEKSKYTSQFFSIPKTRNTIPKDYYAKQDNFIHINIRAGTMIYDGFDLKITDKFIPMMREVLKKELQREYAGFLNYLKSTPVEDLLPDTEKEDPKVSKGINTLKGILNELPDKELRNLLPDAEKNDSESSDIIIKAIKEVLHLDTSVVVNNMTDEQMLASYIEKNIIDSDGKTITDEGIDTLFQGSILAKFPSDNQEK